MSEELKKSAVVVHVPDEYQVVINKGSNENVRPGDTYLIYALGPHLRDPETNEQLGQLEIVRGRAIVRHVQDRIATLETIEYSETPGKRRIIKRDGGGNIMAISLGIPQREEIEELPEQTKLELKAERGDYAKLLRSTVI